MTASNQPLTCYIIAGEVSGDRLGAGMMRELKAKHPGIRFAGVGGPQMEAEGLLSLFPYNDLALMGFAEVLPKAMQLMSRIGRVVEHIEFKRPDIIVTIDSPGFNFRVVKKAKKNGIKAKFVHVVAPTVWAYKEKRAKECAELFDHMLVLLPFEPPYFEKVGLPTTFIGHPSVAEGQHAGNGAAFRKRHHITDDQTIIALLPGSRKNEVTRHIGLMSQVMNEIAEKPSDIVLVSSAPPHLRDMMAEFFMTSPHRNVLLFTHEDKMDAFAAADVALVKSGTVSLEMAYANTPMVVMYKVNALTAMIVKKLIKVPYVSLINILLKRQVIPEYLQENATVEKIASHVKQLLENPKEQQEQVAGFNEAVQMLRKASAKPTSEAAQIISDIARSSE